VKAFALGEQHQIREQITRSVDHTAKLGAMSGIGRGLQPCERPVRGANGFGSVVGLGLIQHFNVSVEDGVLHLNSTVAIIMVFEMKTIGICVKYSQKDSAKSLTILMFFHDKSMT
jgi:hypothetical protein